MCWVQKMHGDVQPAHRAMGACFQGDAWNISIPAGDLFPMGYVGIQGRSRRIVNWPKVVFS
ncbi:hypothetical protein QG37_01976 [Candidozyma auris]|nr:hypothetical protein QG37_01976 [[Candida] auris]